MIDIFLIDPKIYNQKSFEIQKSMSTLISIDHNQKMCVACFMYSTYYMCDRMWHRKTNTTNSEKQKNLFFDILFAENDSLKAV